jgi:hypothetical protein
MSEQMNVVLSELKQFVKNSRQWFNKLTKEEQHEIRTLRKNTNEYVDKVTKEWKKV